MPFCLMGGERHARHTTARWTGPSMGSEEHAAKHAFPSLPSLLWFQDSTALIYRDIRPLAVPWFDKHSSARVEYSLLLLLQPLRC